MVQPYLTWPPKQNFWFLLQNLLDITIGKAMNCFGNFKQWISHNTNFNRSGLIGLSSIDCKMDSKVYSFLWIKLSFNLILNLRPQGILDKLYLPTDHLPLSDKDLVWVVVWWRCGGGVVVVCGGVPDFPFVRKSGILGRIAFNYLMEM